VHDVWLEDLRRTCEDNGLVVERFRPRLGDALLWHADLVHGGMPIEDPEATRESIVGHYCPVSTVPLYVSDRAGRRARHRDAWFSSDHLDVDLGS
jgi:hypothetical protein